MINDPALGVVFLVGCLVLVSAALVRRRMGAAPALKMAIWWLLIFLVAVAMFSLKDLLVGRRPPVVRGNLDTSHIARLQGRKGPSTAARGSSRTMVYFT